MRVYLAAIALLCLVHLPLYGAEKSKHKIEWSGWTDDLFERAKKENRFVILDLEAVWCHWCHVMEEKTYSNAKVIDLIRLHFLPVRVDQDSRPDLSNLYEDYGWPATVIFAPNGEELAKERGFIEPAAMAQLLQEIINDPRPRKSAISENKLQLPESAFLTSTKRETLRKDYLASYDHKHGGWGSGHKLVDADSMEWAMRQAANGDKVSEQMAQETLTRVMKLLDPAWGGVYQYSVGGDWNQPHFEKIMMVQADAIRTYALAYSLWRDKTHLKMASETQRFLQTFLMSPEGAFYTSQDADLVQGQHSDSYFALSDKKRRAKGIPRVDKHIYSRENGWAASALVLLGMATEDDKPIGIAEKAASWILAHRLLPGGGFRHGDDDGGRVYLGDSLTMGQTFLNLYMATGDRKWLGHARTAADFVDMNFGYTDPAGRRGGYITANTREKQRLRPQRDENVAVVRFCNLLHQYTGDANYRKMAEDAMRFLVSPAVLERFPFTSVLIADTELSSAPLHLTIVGSKNDSAAKDLFRVALAYPSSYKRGEWWDKKEGDLPRADVTYPELKTAAAFVCTNSRCSLPITKSTDLREKISRILSSSNAR